MKRLIIISLLLVLLTACPFVPDSVHDWGYKRALPKTATDINEWFMSGDLLPDYEYYLKAKITRIEFKKYCAIYNLKLHTDTSTYSDDIGWLSITGVFPDSVRGWWDDIHDDSLYVWQEGHEWNIARYIDGYLYLYAHCH